MIIQDLQYDFDDELSLKSFSNQNFSEAEDIFSGKNIYGSVFYNEVPDSKIFPKGMKGVTFVNCNMDNLIIPEGNEVIYTNGLSQKRFENQNDGNDWLIDENNEPVKPVNHKIFTKLGLPMPDPIDIPEERVSGRAVDLIKVAEEANQAI